MVGTVARCLIETETWLGTFCRLDIRCRSPLVELPFPLEVVFVSGAWNISLLIHCLSRTKWRGAQVIKLYFKSPFCTSAAIMWCGGCTNKVPNMGSLHLLHLLQYTVHTLLRQCGMCDDDVVTHCAIMILLYTDPSWFYVTSVTLRYWGNDYPATAQYAGRLSPASETQKGKVFC